MYEQPVNQGAVAGTYSRSAAVVGPVGRWPTSILTRRASCPGNSFGCTFSGSAVPRGSANALDLTVTFSGSTCTFGHQHFDWRWRITTQAYERFMVRRRTSRNGRFLVCREQAVARFLR